MLTLYQSLHGMFTVDELSNIERLIFDGITEKELAQIFAGRSVYVSEGAIGDIPIQELPVPYKQFVNEILSIKSKYKDYRQQNIFSLLVSKEIDTGGLHHHIFHIEKTPYTQFTDEKIDPNDIWENYEQIKKSQEKFHVCKQ